MNNDLKIGLAFSGGGYRAAAFSLGVLTYLSKAGKEGSSLLDSVIALSTVSGGTIAGAAYAIGRKRGQPVEEIYREVYRFMTKTDLIALGLDRLASREGWSEHRVKSLINAFADIYDRELFRQATFGELMTDDSAFHLRHLSFNATEFSNGMQFRFQWSEPVLQHSKDEPARGIIGNYYCRTPESIARNIRMADILAASSCFPGGFEPINFPDDFIMPDTPELKDFKSKEDNHIGLMDGGIVDNQGITPLLLADDRMIKNQKSDPNAQNAGDHVFDLLIISDVASPFMEDFKASVQSKMNFWRSLSINRALLMNLLLFGASVAGLVLPWISGSKAGIVVSTIVAVISTLLFVAVFFIRAKMKAFTILKPFHKPLRKLLRINFLVYENLLVNRAKSVAKMTGEVFLKHVRRLNYQKVFQDDTWKNRRLMNAIYELKPGNKDWQKKLREKTISEELVPSAAVQAVAEKASGMSTTLWFTKKELSGGNMPDALVACGQFTICWNLLEYISKVKKDPQNTNPNHQVILDLESVMMEHWKQFQIDPYWMLKELPK